MKARNKQNRIIQLIEIETNLNMIKTINCIMLTTKKVIN